MKRRENNPIIPYMMNSPYYQVYDSSSRRRGYINCVNNMPYYGYRGAPYYGSCNMPHHRESQRDAYKTYNMYGRRTKRYNDFLKRWETQLSDVRMVTVERDEKTGQVDKYVHTPYIMSEQYFTEFEFSLLKWRIIGIASIIVALIVIAVFALTHFNVI